MSRSIWLEKLNKTEGNMCCHANYFCFVRNELFNKEVDRVLRREKELGSMS